MKRLIALVTVLVLCCSLTGCKLMDYRQARELYDAGEFAQALEIYRTLGDYADSAAMADICWQKADYETAEALFAAGDYAAALPLYTGLTMYMDSPMKVISCQYALGMECLENRDYAGAIEWLLPLGSYSNSADQVHLARWEWLTQARCTRVFADEPGNFRAISLEKTGDEGLLITLENRALLLGLPYSVCFRLTLHRNDPIATYTVDYRSDSGGTVIEEVAAGTVELSAFRSGGVLPVETFTQTVTNEAGEQTVSNAGADAIMIRSVIADSVAQILEQLPALVEKTGADITLADIGLGEQE